jgi:putative membrane protein
MDASMQSKVDDKKFARDAALDGMIAVQLGKLAAEKASRDDVKQFGQKMLEERTKVDDQLKELAGQENVAIPNALDSKHQSRIDKLSKLSGEDFDKAFVKELLKDNDADIRDFSRSPWSRSSPNEINLIWLPASRPGGRLRTRGSAHNLRGHSYLKESIGSAFAARCAGI